MKGADTYMLKEHLYRNSGYNQPISINEIHLNEANSNILHQCLKQKLKPSIRYKCISTLKDNIEPKILSHFLKYFQLFQYYFCIQNRSAQKAFFNVNCQ